MTRWELKQVRDFLFDAREKWFDIGVSSGVGGARLAKIRENCDNEPAACLIEMIREWLRLADPPPTWAALAHVLKSKTINEVELAEKGK